MAAADFEAASCPRVRNEIKKTKLYSNTEPAADINTLLAAGRVNRYEIADASCPREKKRICHPRILHEHKPKLKPQEPELSAEMKRVHRDKTVRVNFLEVDSEQSAKKN